MEIYQEQMIDEQNEKDILFEGLKLHLLLCKNDKNIEERDIFDILNINTNISFRKSIKEIITIPNSNSRIEQIFSMVGYILNKRRRKLSTKVLKNILSIKINQ